LLRKHASPCASSDWRQAISVITKSIGDGLSELRIDTGPGYRVYYTRCGKTLFLLLCAGDKSTQRKDIKRARQMRKSLED